MVTKTTFKKKFPDVKVQKLQTSVVFSRQQVEETVLKMCDSLDTGLLYYNYSNRWITVYTSGLDETGFRGISRTLWCLWQGDER